MAAEASVTPAQKPAREIGFDVARGLLMIYIIVVVHGVYWVLLRPTPAIASILLFEMPPIFIVSGAAYYLSEGHRRRSARPFAAYGSYFARRAVRILTPYWAYALVCWALVVVAFHDADPIGALAAWLDPVRNGGGHTASVLNWHLWFVTPFLIVTAILPGLSRIRIRRAGPLWCWALFGLIVVLADDALFSALADNDMLAQTIRNAVFYSLWAVFGYNLAASQKQDRTPDLAIVLVLSLGALAVIALVARGHVVLDMQENKFPPNALFFLFSCAWVSALMLMARTLGEGMAVRLFRAPWLQPFMKWGYSFYLWQGLGYAVAHRMSKLLGWPAVLIWLAGLVLTLGFGLLAAPLERLRLSRGPRGAAA